SIIERIQKEEVDCHISVKLTQLGLDIDEEICVENMKEIARTENNYNIYVNIDTEDYLHYIQTIHILEKLIKEYKNVEMVRQSYIRCDNKRIQECWYCNSNLFSTCSK